MSITKPIERISVKEARGRAGLSQVQVAVALGISEPTYRRYEREPGLMSLRLTFKLADVLGVPYHALALYEFEGEK